MKPIRGPAHPVNVPCRRCRVPAGEDCRGMVCGRCCPERERDNHWRLMSEHVGFRVSGQKPRREPAEKVER